MHGFFKDCDCENCTYLRERFSTIEWLHTNRHVQPVPDKPGWYISTSGFPETVMRFRHQDGREFSEIVDGAMTMQHYRNIAASMIEERYGGDQEAS